MSHSIIQGHPRTNINKDMLKEKMMMMKTMMMMKMMTIFMIIMRSYDFNVPLHHLGSPEDE